MPTTVVLYQEPTNLDSLIPAVRLAFGDLEGTVYSDTVIRSALIYGVDFLQNNWLSKYQIYREDLQLDPQPSDVPAGYIRINTVDGEANVPNTITEGSVFRNPYLTFTQASPPTIASKDRPAIILAAVYMLRRAQVASSSTAFVSWSTEDIRFSNLGSERSLSKLLADDLAAIDKFFAGRLGSPVKSEFVIGFIPSLDEVTLNT